MIVLLLLWGASFLIFFVFFGLFVHEWTLESDEIQETGLVFLGTCILITLTSYFLLSEMRQKTRQIHYCIEKQGCRFKMMEDLILPDEESARHE